MNVFFCACMHVCKIQLSVSGGWDLKDTNDPTSNLQSPKVTSPTQSSNHWVPCWAQEQQQWNRTWSSATHSEQCQMVGISALNMIPYDTCEYDWLCHTSKIQKRSITMSRRKLKKNTGMLTVLTTLTTKWLGSFPSSAFDGIGFYTSYHNRNKSFE